jgi:hypothetical protein
MDMNKSAVNKTTEIFIVSQVNHITANNNSVIQTYCKNKNKGKVNLSCCMLWRHMGGEEV